MRYAIVGLGNLGEKRCAVLGPRCVATVDPVNPSADFAHCEDLPCESYDAVVLAIPNQLKVEMLRDFLDKGKHVLVEKPLLLPDRQTAASLQQLARERRASWYTSYNHRFEPQISMLQSYLSPATIGRIYHARFLYGNGSVRNVAGSWRADGLGVIEDLGSHLVDLAGYLLDCRGITFEPWSLHHYEGRCFDHAIFASESGHIVLEASFVEWKNRFSIEVYGDRGSVHLEGLPKWGKCEVVFRERTLPSGVPRETRHTFDGPDITWQLDFAHFESIILSRQTSVENDLWISEVLHQLSTNPRRGLA